MSAFRGIAGFLLLLALLGTCASAIDNAVGRYGQAVQLQGLQP